LAPPIEDVMQFLLQSHGDDRVGEAVVAYRQHYGESGLLGSEPYLGIGSALQQMRQAGLRIYLATSKREAFASRILQHVGLATSSMASTAQCQAVSWIISQSCLPTSCPNKKYLPRVVSWLGTAAMTSSALTRLVCAALVCFGDMATEMSLKRLARTNWWNPLRISFAQSYRS